MEFPKGFENQEQWVPVTPVKPIPPKKLPPISNPNWVESGGFGGSSPNPVQIGGGFREELRRLVLRSEGLAQMPYRRLLAIKDPAIASMMNIPPLLVARIGGGSSGGSEGRNSESVDRNQILMNGRIVFPLNRENGSSQSVPPLAPKPQCESSSNRLLYCSSGGSGAETNSELLDQNQIKLNGGIVFPSSQENGSSQSVPPLAPKPQCESSSSRVLYCSSFGSGAETNSESLDQNQILLNRGIVFPSSRENGSSQSIPPLAPKPQCESSSSGVLYCGSGGSGTEMISESLDQNQILLNRGIVFPSCRENGSSQSVPPLAPKPQCESSSDCLLDCGIGDTGAETNSESLGQNQITLNGGMVFPSSRENGSSQSVPPLAPKPQCESSSSRVLYYSSGGSGAETNSESLDKNQILLNWGIVFPLSRENGSNQSLPALAPKPQYKLPENSRVGRVLSEAMASPATPATMEKNWREIIDCLPRETIDLVGETTNESIPPCVSNQLESSQILHFQQQEGEMNVAVNSLEELHVHQVEGENQGIDLNKTPQQKPKRKKHRPKVIKEGTSAKKPQEVTPETTKTTENPSVKRKYVRKKKDLTPVENPSSTVQVVDQEGRSRTKSVKRSLISELEEAQEIDQSQGSSSTILRHNSVETQGREKHSSQKQGPVELKNSGFGFDGNQFVNENVRVPPTPSQPPQPSRLETMKTKYMDEFKRMVSKMSPSPELETSEGENLKTLARKNSCRDIADNHERNLVDGESQAHTSGTDLCSGEIQKKRRTEDGPKDVSSGSSLSTSNPSSGWKNIASRMNSTEDFTLADAQRLMAEKRHVWEHMLMLNQAKRESNIRLQGHSSTSLCTPSTSSPSSDCKTDVNQPSTPDKPPGHRISEDIEIHGPQARIEVLISNQKKSKTRMRKKKDPMDDVIQKLRHLNINGGYQAENAMIPYAVEGGMMMVSFQGSFDIIKKKKPRAKVDLDAESNRVWKLLMGKESSEGVGETEADKEKWWEEERRVFRGRVDSFIARMHLIQGDRRFSRWKGSVVDSVIGVFLTQNVSDHLSSSAFMCLAAKFPSRSNCEHENAYVEAISRSVAQNYCEESSLGVNGTVKNCTNEMTNSNEPLESNDSVSISNVEEIVDLSKDSNLDFCGRELGMGNESPESASGTAVTVTSCTSEIEGEERRLLEDVISSQNSVASSQNSSEFAGQTTYKNSLSEPNFEANGSRSSFMELLEMVGNERISRASFASNYHKNLSNSGFKGLNNSDNISENYRSHLPLPLSSLEKNKDTSISDVIGRKYLSSVGNSTNVISNRVLSNSCLHQQDENLVMFQRRKREELQVEKTPDENKTQVQSQNICPQTCSKLCNDQQKVSTESLKNEPNSKKVKSEAEKKKSYDWDSLRKQACQNGDKKERSQETMDSLDYGALRRAHVSEISQAIRDRGMNNILAERIKDFLDRLVSDHGSVDLEWLRDVPPDKAKDYLLSIRGLGLKSVECVRLLTLHHLAFPVDTNVGRICVRLGWVPLQPLPESLQLHLLEMYPVLETIQRYLWPRLCMLDQRTLYELHYQLITFGKVFCTKSKPNCNACPMRGECKHFASAFASARLALPGPEDKSLVRSEFPISSDNGNNLSHNPIPLPQLVGTRLSHEQTNPKSYEPIIEEPTTPEPEPECIEPSEIDIEDAFYNDPDEIPTIKLNFEEFTQNLQTYIQEHNMELQNGDMSKALVAMNPKAASIPMPKLKNINRLRTEHLVYELPDSHPLLEGIDKREPDDPCPYLLAIWTPGETAQSIEPPQACCNSQDTGNLCDRSTCFSCNSIREARAHTVRGTLLIPCRTANRGSFPLNGTYFQVNEVFADHSSSCDPIDVPRDWIWNLPRRTVYFGTSIPSIFKGLTTEGIQHCFWRGFVCVRGFDRITRAPKPLFARLHFPASKTNRSKRTEATPPKNEETAEKII